MFLTILLLPLASFLIAILFGYYIGTTGTLLITLANIFLSFVFSFLLFWFESFYSNFFIDLWDWIEFNEMVISVSFKYDSLTAVMFIVVTLISTIVHFYSFVYMYTDPFLTRFMSYLSLFTFFMLILVSSGNYLILFFGWEGVGLCSYLLIGFWYTRIQAGKAATKAFIINKIGDLFLLTGIGFMFMIFHSIDFNVINLLIINAPEDIAEIISFFLFVGAVGKSAQVGLHTWLPDAMEGPTPVSALIHAATMVTAGVFLIIRCSHILEQAPRILYMIAIWGGLTAFISGTIGSVQNDIKKIIAYSTCSQLGYMVLACGLSQYSVSFFHLFNHAFFKALLFLSAGSIIHLLNNEQDIRRMGGLGSLSPFLYVSFLISSLALAGFPFLSGFFSKDLIIEISNIQYSINGTFLYWISSISASLTMYYSTRLIFLVFITNYNGYKININTHHKITVLEIILLSVLICLSLVSGFIFKDIFVGFGSNYFAGAIYQRPNTFSFVDLEFIPAYIKLFPVLTGIISFLLAIYLNNNFNGHVLVKQQKTYFELCKWFYNEILNTYTVLPVLYSGRYVFEQYEKRVLELHGPLYFIKVIKSFYNKI